jgi:hypothetical protein
MTTAAELNELAASLATISANLKRHIADEGKRLGDKYSVQHAKAADERIKDKDFELQRQADLVKELRRQLDVAGRYADRFIEIRKVVEDAHRAESRSIGITYLLSLVNAAPQPEAER